MLRWVAVAAIPLFAFAASLHVLYLDPVPIRSSEPLDDCINPDHDFEELGTAIYTLVESLLLADGQLECFRVSSQPRFAPFLMYLFMLATVIMLINMLIALMAKVWVSSAHTYASHAQTARTHPLRSSKAYIHPVRTPPAAVIRQHLRAIREALLSRLCALRHHMDTQPPHTAAAQPADAPVQTVPLPEHIAPPRRAKRP